MMAQAIDFLRDIEGALTDAPLPRVDLGALHPALAGADLVQLALIGFVSWTGGLFMTGGRG